MPTASFSYTGGSQTYTVPAGVFSVTLDVTGAGGGPGDVSGTGAVSVPGKGARVQTTVAVSPGDVLDVYVGQLGATGTGAGFDTPTSYGYGIGGGSPHPSPGGAGGGSTAVVDVNTSTVFIVAGGGGGGGAGYIPTSGGGTGGNGGTPGTAGVMGHSPFGTAGGAGGGGGNAGTAGTAGAGSVGDGGVAGSAGTAGLAGAGGRGGPEGGNGAGGGGGGGYGGGGGGGGDGSNGYDGGGGGGGGCFAPDGSTITAGYEAANGYVTLTYVVMSAPSAPTLTAPAASALGVTQASVTFTGTYNSTDSQNQNAYALRMKLSGGAYQYWNGASWQGTISWNSVNTAPAGSWSVGPITVGFAGGTTYSWSMASQEAGASLQGSFASDSSFSTLPMVVGMM